MYHKIKTLSGIINALDEQEYLSFSTVLWGASRFPQQTGVFGELWVIFVE